MSNWSSIKDLRKKLEREWEQGKLLSARLRGEDLCPRRITLKRPLGNEWAEKWDTAKAWVDELIEAETHGAFTIESQEVNHRQLGRNSFPQAVLFKTDESILSFIGKLSAARIFDELCCQILADFPELRSWLEKRPLVALQYQKQWPRLLAVLKYLKSNPRPGIYVRQLEIPEVDTKFIEKHKKPLSELLDLILSKEMIESSATGAKRFEERYGFLSKPVQVRFRILDPDLYLHGLSDLHVPVSEFCALNLEVDHVFITENEINGLAFPNVKNAIIIFGLGFGLDRLANIQWLLGKKIHYWGDIDTHGYVMLDQLRSYFPQASSFLMDRETLMAHESLWGQESKPTRRSLTRLDEKELGIYEFLVKNLLRDALRLEQERISYSFVLKILKKLV
ncbi:hypothetical protein UWK_01219 [Desulfocapsa sulfexigens DSM 10523]|uniref:Wadjet protein JetD C-terminal domain-containing protein n=1 Tax=Desulfocapsa sulfexigens (strain DSM 10523 / SB164P1) TaxID=1167006 RepID=M1P7X1_DESSD|nr:DUF3322 domain-containing protein [Desulfocapsa sulfexigens]AGF77787.1 hypothetical protein UWK_01219 [Desulfocapsa sulfexigens DSM 10523]